MNGVSILDVILLAAAFGAVVWAMTERSRSGALRTELALTRSSDETVKAQAALSAGAVADALVRRANETFEAQQKAAEAKIEAQLKPMAETLDKFEKKVAEADAARTREAGAIKAHVENLLAASQATQAEAGRLATALKRGVGVQGRWGEHVLRNVLELAGMKAGVDFEEQVHAVSAQGAIQRPDVVVRLPGGVFVIDAKCALGDYLAAQDAATDEAREAAYGRHAASVKSHMQALAAKAYWEQFEAAPDFVAMFIPGDAFLAAAVERAPDLYVQALERRVVLVTPSSLFALCKAVAYGWRVEQQAANAREIAELGRELYKRLQVMGAHVAGLGGALANAVSKYNAFVGSLERNVLTQARRFEALKADTPATPIRELSAVEASVQPLLKLAAEEEPPTLTLRGAGPTSAT
jgi:DNA recombination protein RmuC